MKKVNIIAYFGLSLSAQLASNRLVGLMHKRIETVENINDEQLKDFVNSKRPVLAVICKENQDQNIFQMPAAIDGGNTEIINIYSKKYLENFKSGNLKVETFQEPERFAGIAILYRERNTTALPDTLEEDPQIPPPPPPGGDKDKSGKSKGKSDKQ